MGSHLPFPDEGEDFYQEFVLEGFDTEYHFSILLCEYHSLEIVESLFYDISDIEDGDIEK